MSTQIHAEGQYQGAPLRRTMYKAEIIVPPYLCVHAVIRREDKCLNRHNAREQDTDRMISQD